MHVQSFCFLPSGTLELWRWKSRSPKLRMRFGGVVAPWAGAAGALWSDERSGSSWMTWGSLCVEARTLSERSSSERPNERLIGGGRASVGFPDGDGGSSMLAGTSSMLSGDGDGNSIELLRELSSRNVRRAFMSLAPNLILSFVYQQPNIAIGIGWASIP